MDNLHAVSLLASLIVTLAICLKFGSRPSLKRVIISIVITFLLFSITHPVAKCGPGGNPFMHFIILGGCFLSILIFIEKKVLLISLALIIFISSIFLRNNYIGLVSGDTYAGSLEFSDFIERSNQHQLNMIKELIKSEEVLLNDDKYYNEGWFKDSDVYEKCKNYLSEDMLQTKQRFEIYPLWHSWLTRLYRKKSYNVELWYPGGKLSEGINNLEYRIANSENVVLH